MNFEKKNRFTHVVRTDRGDMYGHEKVKGRN